MVTGAGQVGPPAAIPRQPPRQRTGLLRITPAANSPYFCYEVPPGVGGAGLGGALPIGSARALTTGSGTGSCPLPEPARRQADWPHDRHGDKRHGTRRPDRGYRFSHRCRQPREESYPRRGLFELLGRAGRVSLVSAPAAGKRCLLRSWGGCWMTWPAAAASARRLVVVRRLRHPADEAPRWTTTGPLERDRSPGPYCTTTPRQHDVQTVLLRKWAGRSSTALTKPRPHPHTAIRRETRCLRARAGG